MKLNIRDYQKIMSSNNINMIYNGPIWAGGIDGMAEMLLKSLEHEELPFSASQAVFSVFVEQMNNMLMYSAEKEDQGNQENRDGRQTDNASIGIFILSTQGATYYIHTGNIVTERNAEILKTRIDFLNTLDKKELRKYHKQQLNAENDNPESRGAGIGLIEIARRSSSPIEYEFEVLEDGYRYLTMSITIAQGGRE